MGGSTSASSLPIHFSLRKYLAVADRRSLSARPLNRRPPSPSLSHSSLCSLGPLQSENLVRHRASLFLSVRTVSRFQEPPPRRNAVLLRPPGFVIAISLESNKMGRRERGREKGTAQSKAGDNDQSIDLPRLLSSPIVPPSPIPSHV